MHANIDVKSRRFIAESPVEGVEFIEKFQSNCANMTFSDKSMYDMFFQQVTHKDGGSAMNSIKIFQNAQDFSFSVGSTYSEDQLMYIFLDKFHQGGKYSA